MPTMGKDFCGGVPAGRPTTGWARDRLGEARFGGGLFLEEGSGIAVYADKRPMLAV